MTVLGQKQTKVPECKSNSYLSTTAEYQNQFFINKAADPLNKLPVNPFNFDVCGKNFAKNSEIECDTRKKSYKYYDCDKKHSVEHDLKSHHGSGHSEKPLSCDKCDEMFSKDYKLVHHITTAHGEKKYLKCDFCDNYLSGKEELHCHIEPTHEGKKALNCDLYGKNFKTENGLNSHAALIHTTSVKDSEFKFVTAGDVTRIVRRLNNTKAVGVDGIATEVLKKGINVLASPMAIICNISLSTGIFPDIFKEAIVHPVFKENGKNSRDPASYRPISILPSLSKILEMIVRDTILYYLIQQKILPDSQYGFLPGGSVPMVLICAQTEWVTAKSRGDFVGINYCF